MEWLPTVSNMQIIGSQLSLLNVQGRGRKWEQNRTQWN